jgi:cell division protein FtsB
MSKPDITEYRIKYLESVIELKNSQIKKLYGELEQLEQTNSFLARQSRVLENTNEELKHESLAYRQEAIERLENG